MTSIRWAVIAIGIALIGAACGNDDNTPSGPSPMDPPQPEVPYVAGTYEGTISGWYSEVSLGQYPITMTVTQAGDQVTMEAELEGGVLFFVPGTGTIDSNGVVGGQVDEVESEDCGTRTDLVWESRFTGDSLEYEESSGSTLCGTVRFEGELRKTGS